MHTQKTGFDIDGVLGWWYLAMCLEYDKPYEEVTEYNVPWLIEKMKERDDLVNSGCMDTYAKMVDFTLNIPILTHPESLKGINVDCYITAYPSIYKTYRQRWLDLNGFPKAPLFHVDKSEDKLDIIKERDLNFFIDDKPSTILALASMYDEIKCNPIWFIPEYYNIDQPEIMQDMSIGVVSNMFQVKKWIKVVTGNDFKSVKAIEKNKTVE